MSIKFKIPVLALLICLLIYTVSPSGFISSVLANSQGSTIGGIDVSELKDNEIRSALQTGIANWQAQPIVVSGGGTSVEIDSSIIQFDIDETIRLYESQTEKSWITFWEKAPEVHIPFVVVPNDQVKQMISKQIAWEKDATYNAVMLNASYLRGHEINAVASGVTQIDNERLAVAIQEVPTGAIINIQTVVDALHEQIIGAGEEFSLITQVEPILGSVQQETLSFAASVLYESALKLNAQIIERHQHHQLPSYLSPGLDAFVQASTKKDLRFKNTFSQPVQLKVFREGLNVKFEFYAATTDENATVRTVLTGEVNPRTITRYTQDLPVNRTQVIQEGQPGLRVTVYRTNNVTGGELMVSRDYYAPINRIVLASSKQPPTPNGAVNEGGDTSAMDEEQTGGELSEGEFIDENGGSSPHTDNETTNEAPQFDKGGNLID